MSIIDEALKRAARIKAEKSRGSTPKEQVSAPPQDAAIKDNQTTDTPETVDLKGLEGSKQIQPKGSKHLLAFSLKVISVILMIVVLQRLYSLKPQILKRLSPLRQSKTEITKETAEIPAQEAPAKKVLSKIEEKDIDEQGTLPIFKPAWVVEDDLEQDLVLTGILYSDTEPLAIINDTIYAEGEDVNGFKILSISESNVLVQKGNKQIRLKVK